MSAAEGDAATAPAPMAPTAAAAAPATRSSHVQAIITLVKRSGPASLVALQKKCTSGETLNIKGMAIGVDVLKEALTFLEKDPALATAAALPTPTRSQAAPGDSASESAAAAPAAPPVAPGTRWSPPAPTASALAAKAALEYETAKPFNRTVRVIGGAKVALLSKPDVLSTPTGEYLQDGQTSETVARVLSPKDGRVYLRIKGSLSGWVSTRSRKSFAKPVLAPTSGDALEPPEYAEVGESLAVALLQAVDVEGKEMQPQGDGAAPSGAAKRAPCAFRSMTSRCPILSSPNMSDAAGSTVLQSGVTFEADAVHFAAAENRAYLRLSDGRGWVCERSRASLHKAAVEPLDARAAAGDEDPASKRMKSDDGKKVIILRRSAPGEAEADTGAQQQQASAASSAGQEPQAAVFRSDAELWPPELGPARPVLPDERVKMRRLLMFHGKRISEAARDMKEATDLADTYARTCPAEKELRIFVESVKKEVAKYRKEWGAAVTKMLAARAGA